MSVLLSAPLMEGFVDVASVNDVPVNRAKSLKLGERLRVLRDHGTSILLVDHEDSFVHTLANYFRQTGAEVVTHPRNRGKAAAMSCRTVCSSRRSRGLVR